MIGRITHAVELVLNGERHGEFGGKKSEEAWKTRDAVKNVTGLFSNSFCVLSRVCGVRWAFLRLRNSVASKKSRSCGFSQLLQHFSVGALETTVHRS